jgi:hypothetical protein
MAMFSSEITDAPEFEQVYSEPKRVEKWVGIMPHP